MDLYYGDGIECGLDAIKATWSKDLLGKLSEVERRRDSTGRYLKANTIQKKK